ncbi:MAG: hypothetical protein AB7K24_12985 [Gemmataceae bacterium]
MAGKTGNAYRLAKLALTPVLLAGCLNEDLARTEQVPPSLFGSQAPAAPPRHVALSGAPASVESASRVDQLGRKLIACNPQIGLKPVFSTLGDPRPEVTSSLDPVGTWRVYVTEGLVRKCQTDGELAAILSLELGKMVAQREALTALGTRMPEVQPPPNVRVGTDSGGTFGSPDGTHLAEMARYPGPGRRNGPPPLPPDPRALARGYLAKAGFRAEDLDAAEPALREAEQNLNWEKQFANQPAPAR